MASDNVKDWDAPLAPSNYDFGEEQEITPEERRRQKTLDKLKTYVNRMAYKPVMSLSTKEPNKLTDPTKHNLKGTYEDFKRVLYPRERSQRLKRVVAEFTTVITAEQLEETIKKQRIQENKKNALVKRKQELYYEMLSKLENQCRSQYLNVLIKKFANFIAKLATTMRTPPQLTEPYARMQRGIFCNILLAIGVQPTTQSSIYYCTREAMEYGVCHKLAHAFLSLIIKALDSTALRCPERKSEKSDFEMDKYIKDRLMCAAEKKINNEQCKKALISRKLTAFVKKCDFTEFNH